MSPNNPQQTTAFAQKVMNQCGKQSVTVRFFYKNKRLLFLKYVQIKFTKIALPFYEAQARKLKFQVYKAIAGWLLIIASVKNVCSSQKYIFYVAKRKCSNIGNIGNKSTDTDIVILGPIY